MLFVILVPLLKSFVFTSPRKVVPTRLLFSFWHHFCCLLSSNQRKKWYLHVSFSLFSTTFDTFRLQINAKSGTYTSLFLSLVPLSTVSAPRVSNFPSKIHKYYSPKAPALAEFSSHCLTVSLSVSLSIYLSISFYRFYRFFRKTSCSIVIFVSRIHCFNSSNIPASFPSNFSRVSGFNFTPYPA